MTVFRVVAYNDLHSKDAVVADVLNRVCGLPAADAVALTRQIAVAGKATVGLAETREDAEVIAARMLRFGLRPMIERNTP
ncbi:ATP-dependent Clp protease adaptor ClpS [Kutzneria sp. NPDC052558]|uniref:ATP-dependent Clp protease adaptor ClpS n=1 Tax=Kutzneria sp. NPDC052558 TaxID=3364121 RepID=UPI0037CC48EA